MPKIIKRAILQDSPMVIDNNNWACENKQPCKEQIIELPEPTLTASDCLVQAEQQAALILQEAKEKATQQLNEATQQAEIIKQQAYGAGIEEGRQQGMDQGYREGMIQGRQQALDEMSQNMEQSIRQVQQRIETAENESRKILRSAEQSIVKIALSVAEKIIATQVGINPEVVVSVVKEAIGKVINKEQITIRVHPEDFDTVFAVQDELQALAGGEHSVTIASDHSIGHGGCMIDTLHGSVDARLDTQFQALKRAIQEVTP